MRKQYFPPDRNFLSAHLTLFHHLPPDEESIVEDIVLLSQEQQVLTLHVSDVVSIGRGVAYKIESASLQKVHNSLLQRWQQWLTPQDKQKLWPHITVQNKVAPQLAKETLELLKSSFQPFQAFGIGLDLWEYQGGPWELVKHFPFLE